MKIIEKPFNKKCSSRGGMPIKGICFHIAQTANGGMIALDNWANNPNNFGSWHYGVAKNGRVHHYCPDQFAAWTQGLAWRGGVPYNPYGKRLDITRLAKMIQDNRNVNPNQYLIGVEHEGNTGEPWTDAMYKSNADLVRYCSKKHGFPINRYTVLGHFMIDYIDRRSCPGTGFDFDTFFNKYLKKPKKKKEPAPKKKPDNLYRVYKKGKQIGAYKKKDNAFNKWYNKNANKVTFRGKNITSQMEAIMTNLEKKLNNLSKSIKSVATGVKDLGKEDGSIRKDIKDVKDALQGYKQDIKGLNIDVSELRKEFVSVNTKINKVKERVTTLENEKEEEKKKKKQNWLVKLLNSIFERIFGKPTGQGGAGGG